jgi:excisionase family DNA binding protein
MTHNSDVLNAVEAADFLGAHVETIRRLARKGRIPSFKIGKDWRFRKEDLLQWAETHHLRSQPPTILVVDDDDSVRNLVRQVLEKKGYDVCEAADGIEGLGVFNRENVFLILLDLEMPEMNGAEFLTRLRHFNKDVPVVLITGFPDSQLIMDAMQQSPVMLLPKPIEKELLLRVVDVFLKKPA